MIKSVILILCSVIFILINISQLILKPNYNMFEVDEEDYNVYYQKWIGVVVFMTTIIMALISISFAIDLHHYLSLLLVILEFMLVIIYSLCKNKVIEVHDEKITVKRLFRKDINADFSEIIKVNYIPNAKLDIKLKKNNFSLSFNSVNFYRFYLDLINHKVKFKTGRIPKDQDHVYLTKYNISIFFPKLMFREYLESDKYFHNSRYLFSARNLEAEEHFEGYFKEYKKGLDEFCKLVSNDLKLNGFNAIDKDNCIIDNYNFIVIKGLDKKDKAKARLAYIYEDISKDNYFVLYADYLIENEEEFVRKISSSIKRSQYEDGTSRMVRV